MPEEYTTLEASDGIRDATEGSRRRGKPDKGSVRTYVRDVAGRRPAERARGRRPCARVRACKCTIDRVLTLCTYRVCKFTYAYIRVRTCACARISTHVRAARVGDRREMDPSPAQLAQLQAFVKLCQANPGIIHRPGLIFFKSWLER